MRKICTTFLIFYLFHFGAASIVSKVFTFDNAKKVGSLVMKSYTLEKKVNDDTPEVIQALSTELNAATNNLRNLGLFVRENLDGIVLSIPEDVETATEINNDLRDIFNRIVLINGLFKSFYLEYVDKKISDTSLNVFIAKATSIDEDSPAINSFKIYSLIHPGNLGYLKPCFFSRIAQQLKTNVFQRCKKHQSPQQFLFELYDLIETVETRAFMMITTAYKLKSLKDNENLSREMQFAHNEHEKRLHDYLSDLQGVVNGASTLMFSCMPQYYSLNHLEPQLTYAVSLRPKISDYNNNMVVTGLRLVVLKGIIHIQIEEGKLGVNGDIVAGTERWIPVDDMDFASKTIHQNGVNSHMSIGTDFQTVTWWDYVETAVRTVPENCVIVGANFDTYDISDTNKKIFYLRLHYAKIVFSTGEVIPSTYSTTHEITYGWGNYEVFALNREIKSFSANSNGNENFVNLPNSYLDWQNVVGEPRIPFTGVGFKKYDNPSYGRSLSLQVSTLNLMSRIDIN
ncbi:uncharacterized protein [Chelonus insularis]|uniref:uncharacterized protein n=1 Tax=Chelonus insularis TaxID=460826 RepID=UPI00158D3DB8|nr:uncharacterized protein LOC118067555 [Chelonus insularis]